MGKILDFPIEYWSDRDREKLNEIQNDILLEKAYGRYNEDYLKISDEEWAERVRRNLEEGIKKGEFFSWFEGFKEEED